MIYLKNSPKLFGSALALCVCLCLVLSSGASNTTASQNRTTRLQARVSLESKSFDSDGFKSSASLLEPAEDQFASETLPSFDVAEQRQQSSVAANEGRSKTEKSSRRLSNIWSMFLPGASDYEESVDDSASESGSSSSSLVVEELRENNNATATSDKIAIATQMDRSSNLPPRPSAQNATEANMTNSSNANLAPVQLVSGALTHLPAPIFDKSPIGNNATELLSNSISSMGTNNKTKLERESDTSNTSNEDEEEDDQKGGASFERWLSRIKLQQQEASSSTLAPPGDDRRPLRATAAWHLRAQSAKRQQPQQLAGGAAQPPSGSLFRWPPAASQQKQQQLQQQQQQQALSKGGHPQELLAIKTAHPKRSTVPNWNGHAHSHPFQQQMRQQQQQQQQQAKGGAPTPLASTISVNTNSDTHSTLGNTSLSFGSHYIPQINPINSGTLAESSPVVPSSLLSTAQSNSNHKSANESSSLKQQEPIIEQSSMFQSQDEILRQVTSAINFEQQQLQQQQQQQMLTQQQRRSNNSSEPAGSRPGEELRPDGLFNGIGSMTNHETPEQPGPSSIKQQELDRVLKQMASAAAGSRQAQQSFNGSLGTEDIDKSFDLLAERVRQLAMQQQLVELKNATTGAQLPSWLFQTRGSAAPIDQMLKSANLSSGIAATPLGSHQLDQIRDLLGRHEKTKNELKSSQESMERLVKQMIQLKAASQTLAAANERENIPSDLESLKPKSSGHKQQQQVKPAGVSNVGWFPVDGVANGKQQQQRRPPNVQMSPYNTVKGLSLKQQQQLRQQQFSQGSPLHQVLDSAHLIAQQPQHFEGNALGGEGHHLVGLPIALLKNEQQPISGGAQVAEFELSHGQIEEAARAVADQLSADPAQLVQGQQAAKQLAVRPTPQMGRQQRPPASQVGPRLAPSIAENQQQDSRRAPTAGEQGGISLDRQQQQLVQQPLLMQQQVERLSPQQFVTSTIVTPGGPPLKLREISFIRPFGFRGHHAISYQAPPAVAAMMSRLKATSASSTGPLGAPAPLGDAIVYGGGRPSAMQARPSGLFAHHMSSPIRAKLAQAVLQSHHRHPFHHHHRHFGHHNAPFAAFKQASRFSQTNAYPTHNSLGATLPVTQFAQATRPHYSTFSLSSHPPVRRSQPHQPGVRSRHMDSLIELSGSEQALSQELIEPLPELRGVQDLQLLETPAFSELEGVDEELQYVPLREYLEAQERRQQQTAEKKSLDRLEGVVQPELAALVQAARQNHARRALESHKITPISQKKHYERIEQPSRGFPSKTIACAPQNSTTTTTTTSATPTESSRLKSTEPQQEATTVAPTSSTSIATPSTS